MLVLVLLLCTHAFCSMQGSATLSMAYAAALFGDAVLRGLNGSTATECAYVDSDVTDVPFFATKVKLGTDGESWRGSHGVNRQALGVNSLALG